MLNWPTPKDPDESYRLRFNWQSRTKNGETIETSIFIVEGDVEIEDKAIDGSFTSFRATGGTLGEACKITNRVTILNTTGDTDTFDQTATLRIRAN